MSNKPPKHSELKKKETAARRMRGSWGKPRAAAPSIRIRPERFLIVAEGTRTEPLYFEGFRRRINAAFRGEYVTLRVYGIGANTVSLFDRAKSIADADPDGFTQVAGRLRQGQLSGARLQRRCRPVRLREQRGHDVSRCVDERGVRAVVHPALHVHRLRVGKRVDEPILTRCLREDGAGYYAKNRSDMFEVLERRTPVAIANAEKLEHANAGRTPADSNPGTSVHLLVKELLPYTGEPKEGGCSE